MVRAAWVFVWVVVLLGLVGCGAESPPLILISIDTLRSDHLPAYGYAGVETPALDALRADSVLFERAYTQVPLTLPAHTSMLTGLLPPQHGVRTNRGYRLASETPFLPGLLAAAGYRTGGAVSSFVLRRETGFARGFEVFDDRMTMATGEPISGFQRRGGETLAAIVPWLERVAGEPFFLFLHLYDPHAPYDPPEPFASRYEDDYDGEIAYADGVVGQLIAELQRLGVYDRAAVVVTSDHGDDLGDHGEHGHGIFLYRSTLQVPLFLKLPRGERAGESVSTPVQVADVAPTLLALAGEEVPPAVVGRSLLGEVAPGSIYSETYYSRLSFGWSELRSLIDDRFQYIESAQPELYDLVADPAAERNLLAEERRAAGTMRQQLGQLEPRFELPGDVDPESQKKLAALGYLGGANIAFEGELPPPQTQKHLIAGLQRMYQSFSEARFGETVTAAQAVLDENPHAIVAWEHMAMAFERMGRRPEAIAAYRETLDRSDGEPHVALTLASLLLETRQTADARAHAELALDASPVPARELLARIALAEGDHSSAASWVEEGMAIEPHPGLYLIRARIARDAGAFADALAEVETAASLAGGAPVRDLEFLRGELLARLGRLPEAEAAFRREIELAPRQPRAYSTLAVVLALSGRRAEAASLLKELVTRYPSPAAFARAIETLRGLEMEDEAATIERRQMDLRQRAAAAPARSG